MLFFFVADFSDEKVQWYTFFQRSYFRHRYCEGIRPFDNLIGLWTLTSAASRVFLLIVSRVSHRVFRLPCSGSSHRKTDIAYHYLRLCTCPHPYQCRTFWWPARSPSSEQR